MNLDNVRDLQRSFRRKANVLGVVRGVGTAVHRLFGSTEVRQVLDCSIGIAINWDKANDYRLAVRLRSDSPWHRELAEKAIEWARGEADVLFTPPVKIIAGCDGRPRRGPATLSIGASIGRPGSNDGGTLGFFARRRGDGVIGIVSNNHVIADHDNGRRQDPVVHPSGCDHGGTTVARLDDIVNVRTPAATKKLVDCAFAVLVDQNAGDRSNLFGGGTLLRTPAVVTTDSAVIKIGRTTGRTAGRVKAFDFDKVIVRNYHHPPDRVEFVDQIEIESLPAQDFSDRGDSGSLVINSSNQPVGLLFAEAGRLQYANPIGAVLTALNVDIVV